MSLSISEIPPHDESPPRDDLEQLAKFWSLIGPEDPPPFSLLNENGSAPFLLVCDHASRAFPRAMNQLGVADWVLEKHVAWDIGAEMVARYLSERFDAPAVLAGYSRLVVDLNRKLHDTAAFIPVSDGITIPGNLNISEEEKMLRTRTFYEPYHDAIDQQVRRFTDRGHTPALVSIHTCTPVFNDVVRQMHFGIMWDQDGRVAQPLIENLSAMEGICVGDNEPYSGRNPNDHTVSWHAGRTGLPSVAVEVRQDLVDTIEGAQKWGALLGDGLQPIVENPDLYRLFGE